MSKIGHNSKKLKVVDDAQKAGTKNVGGVAGDRLKSIIDRIENLESEKKDLADDMKEVYSEAKGSGFDIKVIRKIIRLRKMDPQKRREEDEITELYKSSIGMM